MKEVMIEIDKIKNESERISQVYILYDIIQIGEKTIG